MLERTGSGPYSRTFTLTDQSSSGFPAQHFKRTYTFVVTTSTAVFAWTDSGYFYKKGQSFTEYPPQTGTIEGPIRYAR